MCSQRLVRWVGWLCLSLLMLPSIVQAEPLQLKESALKQLEERFGLRAIERLSEWSALMNSDQNQPEMDKLTGVNTFFNKIRFLSDQEHWGKEDYWATPAEFIASNGGDCEDFAIAKFFTLRALGVPADSMRLAYVKSLALNQAHVVLAYYPAPGMEPLVLDNLLTDILPASRRKDLVPVYTFNAEGLWQSQRQGEEAKLGSGDDVLLWKDLIDRMKQEYDQP